MIGAAIAGAGLFLALAPLGVAPARGAGARAAILLGASTLAALALAVATTGVLLRALSVSGPSFELGAALGLLPLAARRIALGTSAARGTATLLLGGPGAIGAAIAYTSRFGPFVGALAVVLASCAAAALAASSARFERARPAAARWLGRLAGVALLSAAAELALHWFTTV